MPTHLLKILISLTYLHRHWRWLLSYSSKILGMANKREAVVLYQRRRRKRRRRSWCTYPPALPRGSILSQRNRSGAILLPLFFLCFLFLQELWLPFLPSCYLLCAFMLYGCFSRSECVCFCLRCVWARFCPALRAASLQWAAVQQTGFGFLPSGPLVSHYPCTPVASAYRQRKKTAPVTCFPWNKSSQ